MSSNKELSQAEELLQKGMDLRHNSQFQEAADKLDQARLLYEKWQDWNGYFKVINELTYLKIQTLPISQAQDFITKELTLASQKLPDIHPEYALLLTHMGKCQNRMANYRKAISYYKQAIAKYEALGPDFKVEKANALAYLGVCYTDLNDFDLAVEFCQKALKIHIAELGPEHFETGATYNELSNCYAMKDDYDNCLKYLKKSVRIISKSLPAEHPTMAILYNNMGSMYKSKGDIEQALHYLFKALEINLKVHGEVNMETAICMSNIGSCYDKKREVEKGLEYYQKVLSIFQQTVGEKSRYTSGAYHSIARCYRMLGRIDEAINTFEKSLAIDSEILGDQHSIVGNTLNSIAVCHLKTKNFEESLKYGHKALEIRQKVFSKYSILVAHSKTNLGQVFFDQKDYHTAATYFHQAIQSIDPSFTTEDINKSPSLDNAIDSSSLFRAICDKAKALHQLYLQTSLPRDLLSAFRHYQLAVRLLNTLRQSYKTEGSKLLLAKKNQDIFDESIQSSITLSGESALFGEHLVKEAKAFAFTASEQSKSILLLSSLKDTEAKATANIPAELLEKEKQLKIELNYLDKAIAQQEALKDKQDKALLLRFKGQYFDYKQQYDQLIEQFEKEYPQYFQLKFNIETASIEQIQQQLDTGTFFIEYFVGKSCIYLFAIDQNSYSIHQITKPDNFSQLIRSFRQAMEWMDESLFADTGYELFRLLLSPVVATNSESQIPISRITNLLIIPHGELLYLPFDALLTSKPAADTPEFHQLPYLIRQFSITYHYSATLWLNGISRQVVTGSLKDSFLGIAPVTFDGSKQQELAIESSEKTGFRSKVFRSNNADANTFESLPSTEVEVKAVYDLFQQNQKEAKALLYGAASKQNLEEYAQQHKYILISTHGFMQDGNAQLSGIQLAKPNTDYSVNETSNLETINPKSDTKKQKRVTKPAIPINSNKLPDYQLYTSEAYHLHLNADLVVLSSCESGVGELADGEGMMALNRGFLYAGASNIIFSLFEVPDDATGKLIPLIFEFILQGDSYSQALRKAKIKLLDSEDFSPQDWAGMVLIGC